jgi:hypothetical protein
MVGIIQMFTKQDVMPLYGALLDTMEGSMTHKTTTHTEEGISIVQRESR